MVAALKDVSSAPFLATGKTRLELLPTSLKRESYVPSTCLSSFSPGFLPLFGHADHCPFLTELIWEERLVVLRTPGIFVIGDVCRPVQAFRSTAKEVVCDQHC